MPEFFSSDGSLLLQFAVIFAVLVVVLMAAYLVYRRFAGRGLSMAARGGARSRQPRLGIVDIYELDRQRQLILLRRDNVEHLLLVGGPNDLVVERNVQRGGGARLPSERAMRPEPAPEVAAEPIAGGTPGQQPLFPAPAFEMPVVVPPPLPGSDAAPDARAPRLDPALFETEPSEPAPEPMPAQEPTREPLAAEPAGARARANRFLRRTPPPLVAPKPEATAERAPSEPTPEAVPPVMAAPEPRAVDPAVLSDMARQLEVALRRPSSAVTPPPGLGRSAPPPAEPAAPPQASTPAPVPAPSPAPPAPEAGSKPDPIAAAMAASRPAPSPESPMPGASAPVAELVSPARPADHPVPAPPAAAAPAPANATPEPVAPPPAPRPIPPVPVPPVPVPPAPRPAPEPAKENNAFSVEEIEAEFARLLGRPLDKKN